MIKIKTSVKKDTDIDISVNDKLTGYSSTTKSKKNISNKVKTKRNQEKDGNIEQNIDEAFRDVSENIIEKLPREIG